MLRALFVEYPDDPGSWLIDDQYLFGSDILVAPFFENVTERSVYLPPGEWIDYQTGKVYPTGWHTIAAGNIPIVMLVKNGSVIPHIKLAQSTQDMDWNNITLKVYATDINTASGKLFIPGDTALTTLKVSKSDNAFKLTEGERHNTKFKIETIK